MEANSVSFASKKRAEIISVRVIGSTDELFGPTRSPQGCFSEVSKLPKFRGSRTQKLQILTKIEFSFPMHGTTDSIPKRIFSLNGRVFT
jgi:hypothetical protein